MEDELKIIQGVLESGRLNYLNGEYGKRFERDFRDYFHSEYAVSCNSGTNALILALQGLNLPSGSEVITTPMTFVSTVHAIILAGLVPRIVDIEADCPVISSQTVRLSINDNTSAILPVHIFGYPCNMGPICSLAGQYKLKVIEDCAQAIGSKVNGKYCGTFGHASAFSFCFTKIVTLAGEGGMVMTSDKETALKIAALRNVGYRHEYDQGMLKVTDKGAEVGYNMRLLEIQSALGIYKLSNLGEEFQMRKNAAVKISQVIHEIPWLTTYTEGNNREIIYNQMPLLLEKDKTDIDPSQLVGILKKNGIPVDTAYSKPVNHYEFYRNYLRTNHLPEVWGGEEFPNFNDQSSRLFIIKLSSKHSDSMFDKMYEVLRSLDGNQR
jgi:dTDP-4-amino-4,6-dideoxygalactose transaminase